MKGLDGGIVIMHARLEPLEGKYYGTRVIVTNDVDEHEDLIEFYVRGNGKPSEGRA